MECTACFEGYHLKCISKFQGNTEINGNFESFLCEQCLWTQLPFLKSDVVDTPEQLESNQDIMDKPDHHLLALASRPKHRKFMHLNTQSLLSSLDELILTMEKYPFDIIAMTETWLKDNVHLLQHAMIPGYSPEFRHRNNLRGGGVEVYIRDSLEYKRRKDIENVEPDLEHLWLELPGRNKQ